MLISFCGVLKKDMANLGKNSRSCCRFSFLDHITKWKAITSDVFYFGNVPSRRICGIVERALKQKSRDLCTSATITVTLDKFLNFFGT